MSQTPYDPPTADSASRLTERTPSSWGPRWVPAILAAALTFALWFAFTSALDQPSDKLTGRRLRWLWFATIHSTLWVTWFWRSRTYPLAFAGVFTLFAVAFCLFVGDASSGVDRQQLVLMCGTILTVPALASLVAYLMAFRTANRLARDGG